MIKIKALIGLLTLISWSVAPAETITTKLGGAIVSLPSESVLDVEYDASTAPGAVTRERIIKSFAFYICSSTPERKPTFLQHNREGCTGQSTLVTVTAGSIFPGATAVDKIANYHLRNARQNNDLPRKEHKEFGLIGSVVDQKSLNRSPNTYDYSQDIFVEKTEKGEYSTLVTCLNHNKLVSLCKQMKVTTRPPLVLIQLQYRRERISEWRTLQSEIEGILRDLVVKD